MRSKRFDALQVAATLADACEQFRVTSPQARQLFASEILLDRHCRRVDFLFAFRVDELLQRLRDLRFRGLLKIQHVLSELRFQFRLRFRFQFQFRFPSRFPVGLQPQSFEIRIRTIHLSGIGDAGTQLSGGRLRSGRLSPVGWLRRRWFWRSWAIAVATLAANTRVFGGRRGCGLRLEDLRPVELDIRVVLFDPPNRVFVERRAADLDARRRAKPVQNALPRSPVAAAGMDKRRCFVPTFVAGEPQKWQSYLRLDDRPFFLPDFAAGFFFAVPCLAEAFEPFDEAALIPALGAARVTTAGAL